MAPEPDLLYALIMCAAVVAGALTRRFIREPPVKTPAGTAVPLCTLQRLSLPFGAIVGGALGAKLPYVLGDPAGAISGAAWFSDGRTITWGFVGGYFGVELAKLLAGVKGKTGDGFAAPLAVSVAVGRLACFHAGCCFGAETGLPWGVDFGDGIPRHPNQLYEVAFHLTAAAALVGLQRRGRFPTQRVKLYLLGYMVFRFFSELWRPEPLFAFGLTFYQLSAAAFAVLFAMLFWWDQRVLDRGVVHVGGSLDGSPTRVHLGSEQNHEGLSPP